MSREIKIRAWDGKRMVYLSDLSIGLKKSKSVSPYAYFSVDTFGGHVSLGKHEIMQSTDLLDINGNEIYEGDIIKQTIPYDPETRTGEFIEIGKVVYDDAMYQINDYPLYGCLEFECEIIGNIYQNPELIK